MEIGLPGLLTIIFLILKLTGAITWSWWWVFSPLLVVAGFYVLVGVVLVIAALAGSKKIRRQATRRFRR